VTKFVVGSLVRTMMIRALKTGDKVLDWGIDCMLAWPGPSGWQTLETRFR